MQEPVVSLAILGIEPVSPATQPHVYAELYRAAKRLRDGDAAAVGLLPAGRGIDVATAAVQLGLALGDACQASVAVVDANTRKPAFSERLPGAVPSTGFSTVWLGERLALLTPAGRAARGLDLAALEKLLAQSRARFRHLLVDLSGFDELGEHLGAIEHVDGVLVVARSARTDERELLRRKEELADDALLGVLLLD